MNLIIYEIYTDVNQTVIIETVDTMSKLGLKQLGYEYINLDDGWAGGRYPNGTIYAQTPQFNESLKGLADYVHSHGFKFGLYTDRGTSTCLGKPGSFGYETNDAKTYANWGVDYVKEDSCAANQTDPLVAFAEYAKMRDALNATGRPIWFNLCGWNPWYSPMGMALANSWRTGPDDNPWQHILINMDNMAQYNLHLYAGRGGYNDPDCLYSDQSYNKITELQSRAQFSMWAVMASPMIISSDIRNISQYNLETWTNKWVIEVNQDKACKQGIRVYGDNLILSDGKTINSVNCTNIWARELIDGSRAFVFLNACNDTRDIVCDQQCFNNAGLMYGIDVHLYDLWNENKFIGNISTTIPYNVSNVEGEGGVVMYKFVPSFDQYPTM